MDPVLHLGNPLSQADLFEDFSHPLFIRFFRAGDILIERKVEKLVVLEDNPEDGHILPVVVEADVNSV